MSRSEYIRGCVAPLFKPKDFSDYMICIILWCAIINIPCVIFIRYPYNFIIIAGLLMTQILAFIAGFAYTRGLVDAHKLILTELTNLHQRQLEQSALIRTLAEVFKHRHNDIPDSDTKYIQ